MPERWRRSLLDVGRRIAETLNATVWMALYELGYGEPRLLVDGTGRHAAPNLLR